MHTNLYVFDRYYGILIRWCDLCDEGCINARIAYNRVLHMDGNFQERILFKNVKKKKILSKVSIFIYIFTIDKSNKIISTKISR